MKLSPALITIQREKRYDKKLPAQVVFYCNEKYSFKYSSI
jgi:hypothetical protein